MAIANLAVKLEACFKDNCGQIEFSDATLLYNASNNTGGWNDISTFDNIIITSASIDYKHVSETTFNTVDVTADITGQTITGKYVLTTETITTADGLYTFIFSVFDGLTATTQTTYVYSLCNARCCIDKMWTKIEINESCNCRNKKLEKVMEAEGLLKAIKALGVCSDNVEADKLLLKLQRICNSEKCNCGC